MRGRLGCPSDTRPLSNKFTYKLLIRDSFYDSV